MSSSSNSSELVPDIVTASLAGISTIACIISLGFLLYYKMWRSFIYRLVFYTFISLIILSLSTIAEMSLDLMIVTELESGESNLTDMSYLLTAVVVPIVLIYSSLAVSFMLVAYMTICIYLMALHNYQFTYKADICLLVLSIFYLVVVVALFSVSFIVTDITQALSIMVTVSINILLGVPFLVSIVFILLTLVPLCCRACGYNMCMKTAATVESHRKALKEILPLFILIMPSFLCCIWIISFNHFELVYFVFKILLFGLPGLVSALFFAFHLCFIKKSLRKLCGKHQSSRGAGYGSFDHYAHRTTAYTSEGISETCNTEYVPVSEAEEDSRFLLQKNKQ